MEERDSKQPYNRMYLYRIKLLGERSRWYGSKINDVSH